MIGIAKNVWLALSVTFVVLVSLVMTIYTAPRDDFRTITGYALKPSCQDSDNGINIYEQGSAVGVDPYGNHFRKQDDCYGEEKVIEYSCKWDRAGEYQYVDLTTVSCPGNSVCKEGKCQ